MTPFHLSVVSRRFVRQLIRLIFRGQNDQATVADVTITLRRNSGNKLPNDTALYGTSSDVSLTRLRKSKKKRKLAANIQCSYMFLLCLNYPSCQTHLNLKISRNRKTSVSKDMTVIYISVFIIRHANHTFLRLVVLDLPHYNRTLLVTILLI
jgi:hypothetical protein